MFQYMPLFYIDFFDVAAKFLNLPPLIPRLRNLFSVRNSEEIDNSKLVSKE